MCALPEMRHGQAEQSKCPNTMSTSSAQSLERPHLDANTWQWLQHPPPCCTNCYSASIMAFYGCQKEPCRRHNPCGSKAMLPKAVWPAQTCIISLHSETQVLCAPRLASCPMPCPPRLLLARLAAVPEIKSSQVAGSEDGNIGGDRSITGLAPSPAQL